MKILLFANTDWYLFNFRLALAKQLRAEGWEVVLVSPPGEYGERLAEQGFRWVALPFSTRTINPLLGLLLLRKLIALYRLERPQVVHHFTIKCVIYGSIAARWAGQVGRVNAVTGLGHLFTDRGLKASLVRPLVCSLYRLAFGGSRVNTVFQNSEDFDSFVSWGLLKKENCELIRGSGVDVTRFTRKGRDDQPVASRDQGVKILFASRLLSEKGIFELLEAFGKVRSDHPQCELLIAGDIYSENPSSLTMQDLEKMKEVEGVNFLGHVDDMIELLDEVDIVALPSYREGTPRILIEAAAMELPIVASDIAGCQGLVQEGINGLLVPPKRVEPLAEALAKLVADQDLRQRLGQEGRKIVLNDFDERQVNARTIALYHALLAS